MCKNAGAIGHFLFPHILPECQVTDHLVAALVEHAGNLDEVGASSSLSLLDEYLAGESTNTDHISANNPSWKSHSTQLSQTCTSNKKKMHQTLRRNRGPHTQLIHKNREDDTKSYKHVFSECLEQEWRFLLLSRDTTHRDCWGTVHLK